LGFLILDLIRDLRFSLTEHLPMTSHAVLTAIGADRPGLVEEVSEFVFKHGGNIEDSRMANLRGQFAMMLLVTVPGEAMRKMQSAAPALIQHSGLHIEIRPASSTTTAQRPALPYRLTASALDQAGLVHRIAHLLRSLDVNIESMQTNLVAAPYTGAPVFEMDLAMSVPSTLPLSQLRQQLGQLCDELNVDWKLAGL
jgi:glycine cleavage system transcriptional repressor